MNGQDWLHEIGGKGVKMFECLVVLLIVLMGLLIFLTAVIVAQFLQDLLTLSCVSASSWRYADGT